ncbi:MAG: hypothetical protein DME06_11175 [Candidatus Rokuibacteriota bacterium]|nr:MAG: hypothetical protein DME06_11175 [Candidatus Rokubacteria bacterium]
MPRAGDVALFEVVSVGKHSHIEVVTRRQAQIFPADRILAAFGNRYATGQYEGHVPTAPTEQLHILGQGGAIGLVKSAHSTMPKPTIVKLLGYAVDAQGQVINTKYYSRAPVRFSGDVPTGARVILSLGSSMDSGKTTTAGYVARSLKQIGKTVAYLKLTGTVFTKDMDFNKDCGADFVSDFSQMGFPSTYLCEIPTASSWKSRMVSISARRTCCSGTGASSPRCRASCSRAVTASARSAEFNS